jgi:hypothetical protein
MRIVKDKSADIWKEEVATSKALSPYLPVGSEENHIIIMMLKIKTIN